MKIPMYQIDAFTSRRFGGNPAAVCPLPAWIDDSTMQAIAAENNVAETAFFVPENGGYRIRWFTPAVEVDLCGHATVASALVLSECLGLREERIQFQSRSGLLAVTCSGNRYTLDFPSRPAVTQPVTDAVAEAMGRAPVEMGRARDLLVLYENEDQVRALRPNFKAIAAFDSFAVIATAPGNDCDFVSRFFAPAQGIDEDPVTGSAHCTLTPYWAKRLGKPSLFARQVSPRGGELWVEDAGERVKITGEGVLYLTGFIDV